MGIRDINDTIKKYYTYSQCKLDYLKGRCIAVDFGTWMFKYWMPAAKRVIMKTNLITMDPDPSEIRKTWFTYSQVGILRFLNNGVFPVFVFDGPCPQDKEGEKAKRLASKIKAKEEYRELLESTRNSSDILDHIGNMDVLRKKCYDAYSIPREEYDIIMYFLKSMGFNVFKPNCEAEKFCSMLCIDGLVSAVYSSDTDNLAYGCPLWISDIDDSSDGTIVTYISYPDMISYLGVTKDIFTDLCIIHGCDYNNRIKGIGPDKGSKLIMQYHSIDNIASVKDVTPLNHHRCRELFMYSESKMLCDEEINICYSNVDPEVLEYYLSFFEANDYYIPIRDGIEYCKYCTKSIMM